ncbi:MAG TPA: hypothetical protein ENI95_01595 [Chloroflexi bacterium]|nr:hypothetical protein [Chloroflexota bacterium]
MQKPHLMKAAAICALLLGAILPFAAVRAQDAGWTGKYYRNPNLAGAPAATRTDPVITFDWGDGAPFGDFPSDNFSVRWTRTDTFYSGVYIFAARSDDGVRVYVDGTLIIDHWQPSQFEWISVEREMTAGQHTIVVEYYEGTGRAAIQAGYYPRDPIPTSAATQNVTATPTTITQTPAPSPTPTLPYVAGTPGAPPPPTPIPPPPVEVSGEESGIIVQEANPKVFTWEGFPGPVFWSGGNEGRHAYVKNQSGKVTFYARWHVRVEEAGFYDVFVYIPESARATESAAYRVFHAGEESDVVLVNQRANPDRWALIGSFYFATGGSQYIEVSKATGEAPASHQVLLDAVMLIYRP